MEVLFELPIAGQDRTQRQSTQAIYELLKSAIIDGSLAPNTKLPPTRAAGKHFNLSRNSMVSVYERLATEGLVTSHQGAGTFVARALKVATRFPSLQPTIDAAEMIRPAWTNGAVANGMWFWTEQDTGKSAASAIELRPGLIDYTLFPFDEFRRSMAKTLRRMERRPPGHRSPQRSQGNYRLREAIVSHAALMRAIACEADEIIVTAGAQQAFDILARVFVEADKTSIAVEDPCYLPAVAAFEAAGALIRPVPVDDEGLIVSKIPDDVRLIYVTPSNQFPLGVTMSTERRRELLEFARKHRALIIEDDYHGEFRTEGEPLKAIYGVESADLVFYVGTFSKCMFPPLRLGYLIAPAWARHALILAKNCTDWHSPSITQAATGLFIEEGHLSAHVARMRTIYRQRRAALIEAIAMHFGDSLRPVLASYGLQLSARGDPAIDWDAVAAQARLEGIEMHSLSRYFSGVPVPGLLFSLGSENETRLSHAVERLAAIALRHRSPA